MTPSDLPEKADDDEDDGAGAIDVSALKDYVGFVFRAAARHKILALIVFTVVVSLTRFVVWALPRSYHVESRLLAQRNQVIGALAVPSRAIPDTADAPTRLAAETVLRRDNMLALIKETDLVRDWKRNRAPAARLKETLMAKIGVVPTEADLVEGLAATLENSLSVQVGGEPFSGEGTVVIAVDWPTPQMAYRLAATAVQNFLEARHISEIDNISEAISILTGRANSMRDEIDATAMQIEAAGSRRGDGERAAPSSGSEPPAVRRARPSSSSLPTPSSVLDLPARPSTEAVELKASWEAKRTALRDLDDIRKRRQTELQAKLSELRATYADSYPMVVDTLRSLEMLSQESPQVTQLRREEAELRNQYRSRTGAEPEAPSAPSTPSIGLAQLLQPEPSTARASGSGAPRGPIASASTPSDSDDRGLEFLKAQLRLRMEAYDRLLERIDTARMEMETAEVAFKYRYTVIRPAQLPTVPQKPKVALILAGGFLAAIIFALLAAVIADLRSGRIVERWQVERTLDIPVIAEMHMKL